MVKVMQERLVLASRSAARREMLANAGVHFGIEDAGVDEEAIKRGLTGHDPAAMAVELACSKALAVSRRDPDAWVLGADQTLSFDDDLVSKAGSLDEARLRLQAMRGREHALHSGAALARGGSIVWSGSDTATLRMRTFSDAFLESYLASEGPNLLACVGSYRLEGMGAQLFEWLEGDFFTVLGLPLWSVMAELRRAGVLAS